MLKNYVEVGQTTAIHMWKKTVPI